MIDVAVGRGVGVRVLGDCITYSAWPQQRNDHKRAARHAPVAQRLTEVFVVALQAHAGTYVDEAQQAEGGVDDQARSVDSSRFRLGLQHVVRQVADIADVAEEVMDTVFDELRCDVLIPLGQRLERVSVKGIVEFENGTVDAFPRIIFSGLHGHRNQRDAGTQGQLHQTFDKACTGHGHS